MATGSRTAREQQSGSRLPHLPLDLGGVVLLLGAVLRERTQLVVGVRNRPSCQGCLEQPLRDEIRESPVRRGGVGVVLHGEPEVSVRLRARKLEHVLACAQELDHGERDIGEPHRVGLAALCEKLLQRARVGLPRQAIPRLRGKLDDPLPAFGLAQHPSQRREALPVEVARGHAVGGNH